MRLRDALSAGLEGAGAQSIAWTEVEAWPLLAKALCCLAVAAATAAVCYGVSVADARTALAVARSQTARLAAEVASKQALASSGGPQDEAADFDPTLARLPSEAEVPALLDGIGQAAAAEDLAIVRLEVGVERPAWLGMRAAPGVEGSADGDDAKPRYLELPIEIEVRGGYHQLGAFAAAIAGLPHLVSLGDFELRPVDGDPARLALTLTASTYRQANPVGTP